MGHYPGSSALGLKYFHCYCSLCGITENTACWLSLVSCLLCSSIFFDYCKELPLHATLHLRPTHPPLITRGIWEATFQVSFLSPRIWETWICEGLEHLSSRGSGVPLSSPPCCSGSPHFTPPSCDSLSAAAVRSLSIEAVKPLSNMYRSPHVHPKPVTDYDECAKNPECVLHWSQPARCKTCVTVDI